MILVKDIHKQYGETVALEKVTFSIDKAELFGLIGPDGAGKSTIMRILMSLILPDSGSASMNGLDVVADL